MVMIVEVEALLMLRAEALLTLREVAHDKAIYREALLTLRAEALLMLREVAHDQAIYCKLNPIENFIQNANEAIKKKKIGDSTHAG